MTPAATQITDGLWVTHTGDIVADVPAGYESLSDDPMAAAHAVVALRKAFPETPVPDDELIRALVTELEAVPERTD